MSRQAGGSEPAFHRAGLSAACSIRYGVGTVIAAPLSGTAISEIDHTHQRQLLDHAVKPAEAHPVDGNVKHNKRRILVSNIAQKSIEPRSKILV